MFSLRVAEHSIAIMVGCAPALRSLWIAQVINTGLYSKLQSAFSSTRFTQPQSIPPTRKPSGDSIDRIVGISHDYIELGNAQPLEHFHQQRSMLKHEV